jgi:hypothetical protein
MCTGKEEANLLKGIKPYNHEQELQSGKRNLGSARETSTEWEEAGAKEELRVRYK